MINMYKKMSFNLARSKQYTGGRHNNLYQSFLSSKLVTFFGGHLGVVLRSFFLLTMAGQSGNFLATNKTDSNRNAFVSFSSRC